MQKVRFLNKENVIAKLLRLAIKAKASDKNIKEIIFFGSLADNTHTSSITTLSYS